MTTNDLGKIKGRAVVDFITWFSTEHGHERVRDAIEALAPEQHQYFAPDQPNFGLSTSDWYPALVMHQFLEALTRGLSPEQANAVATEGGAATIRSMMRGVSGIVFSMFATPKRYGQFVPKLWRLTYDNGTVEHVVLGPHRDQTRIIGWASHHPLLCRLHAAARQTMFEAVGCRNVTLERHRCVTLGDADCGSILSWEEG